MGLLPQMASASSGTMLECLKQHPAEHRLLIYGLVDRPLIFTMDDLLRFPSVSRI